MEQLSIWLTLVFSVDPTVDEDEAVHFLGVHNTETEARLTLGRWCREALHAEGGYPWKGPDEDEGPVHSYWARPGQRRRLLGDRASLEDAIATYFGETHPHMRYITWQKSLFVEHGQLAPPE